MTKQSKDQKFIIFSLLFFLAVGFILVGLSWGLSFNAEKLNLSKSLLKSVSPSKPPLPQALFALEPRTATKLIGEKLKVSILLGKTPSELSGMALRLNCSWKEKETPIQLVDSVSDKPGVQLETSQELINAGWQYPVNKITIQEKVVIIDLASIYISPEGFKVDKETSLANFYLKAVSKAENLICSFDPSLTKISTKAGEQILLDFKDGNYVILER